MQRQKMGPCSGGISIKYRGGGVLSPIPRSVPPDAPRHDTEHLSHRAGLGGMGHDSRGTADTGLGEKGRPCVCAPSSRGLPPAT